jgi:hypothetical protein
VDPRLQREIWAVVYLNQVDKDGLLVYSVISSFFFLKKQGNFNCSSVVSSSGTTGHAA